MPPVTSHPVGSSPLPRRGLLALALVGVASGCAPDPTVRSSRTRAAELASPSATPTMAAAQVEALAAERALAAAVQRARSAAKAPDAPARATAWLDALTGLGTEHLARLVRTDPLGTASGGDETATPSPSPTPDAATAANWKAAAAQLNAAATEAAAVHQKAAIAAGDGPSALLFTALAVSAHGARTPGPVPVVGGAVPARIEVGDRPEALGVLLSRLRALVQGLQVGIGQLPQPSPLATPARERLTAALAARDQASAWLVAAKLPVPPAELSYAMPGRLTDPASTTATWGLLERDVLDAWARLAAASTGTERKVALAAAMAQADVVRGRGVALTYWPGWV